MGTTGISAGQIMDRVANLLNDPSKTDYTYVVILPYLNMAIEELSELMEESNNSPSNQTATVITVPVGTSEITSEDDTAVGPKYPPELAEIQEVGERQQGHTNDPFVRLGRREWITAFPPNNSLLFWVWEDQRIKFNPNGALTPREIQLKYVRNGIPYAVSENSTINMINSRSYLVYKTAALCAFFIGENESRAQILENQAERAYDRMMNISNKGRQQIMTRHRPFRAAYKARGGF